MEPKGKQYADAGDPVLDTSGKDYSGKGYSGAASRISSGSMLMVPLGTVLPSHVPEHTAFAAARTGLYGRPHEAVHPCSGTVAKITEPPREPVSSGPGAGGGDRPRPRVPAPVRARAARARPRRTPAA